MANETSASQTKQKGPAFRPGNITEHLLYSRGIEAVNWGMAMVNFDLMYQAAKKIGAEHNQIVYWSNLPDWRNQMLTPNPDVIYLMPFFNTKNAGPIVLEIPPADDGDINGSVMDCWQAAIEDVGPAGVDKGKGARYLILPPGYASTIPDGYVAMPSENYQGYALLRSIPRGADLSSIEKAVAYAKRIRLYPLSQASNPPDTVYVDALGKLFDSTIPYDLRFFAALDRMIQYEPWIARDKVMIDILKTIGIEKGKSFAPNLLTQKILYEAVRDAREWIHARYDTLFTPPYFEATHWALPGSRDLADAVSAHFADPDNYPLDGRGLAFSYAFFTAKHLGQGQFYLMTIKDKNGQPFRSEKTYRLKVSANLPGAQYWSMTVYDSVTHAFIRNANRMNRSSQSANMQVNSDGSVDIYFGPKAPPGKESNWIPTPTDGGFEVLFRLYGATGELFEKKWRMEDVEEIVDAG